MRSLSQPLLRALDRLSSELRVSLPARVESYDHTTQRASVKPVLRRSYRDGEVDDMPVIPDVPVVFPRSGGASLTMPVQRGDGVLLVFEDRSIDKWLAEGGDVTPDDPRKHDLSDAVAVPGLYSFADASPAENNEDTLLQYAGSAIRLKGNGDIEIAAGGDVRISGNRIDLN